MKREELKEIGLSDEQINKIMALHGKSIQSKEAEVVALQQSSKKLSEQVETYKTQMTELENTNLNATELQTKLDEMKNEQEKIKSDYQAELLEVKKSTALKELLSQANARNPKAVEALLDESLINYKDDTLYGVSEQLEKLKESDPYLFDLGKKSVYIPRGGKPTNDVTIDEALENGEVNLTKLLEQQLEQ